MGIGKKLAFLLPFSLPLTVVVGESLGGIFQLALPLYVFGIIPFLDIIFGKDTQNPSQIEEEPLRSHLFLRGIPQVWVLCQLSLLFWALSRISNFSMSWTEFLLFALSVGITTGGIGITVAHELGHRSNKWEQFLAKILLLSVSYVHFFIEHNRGHHTHVATHGDPATSREGESFYKFFPRTLVGSFLSAWEIEWNTRKRKSQIPFSLKNEMVRLTFVQISVIGCVGLFFGKWAFCFFLLQSFFAFTLLELVNYIEHYGLVRQLNSNGKPEKVEPIHSWNQSSFLSNALLFHLQRHSDHHAHANRSYAILRHRPEAPELPFGYALMILIALVPPLWNHLMIPRLIEWKQRTSGLTYSQ